jgi:hypothetical protein
MLACLVSFSISVFIPYSLTAMPHFPDFNTSYSRLPFTHGSRTVAVVIPDAKPQSRFVNAILNDFSTASELFTRFAQFLSFRESNLQLPAKFNITAPYLLFFDKQQLRMFHAFPQEPETLALSFLENLTPDRSSVQSLPQLYAHLGVYPLTVITQIGYAERAREIIRSVPEISVHCNVIEAAEELFYGLNLEGATFALFRSADQAIVPMEPTPIGLSRASVPFYSRLTPQIFQRSEIFAAYIDEKYDEQRHSRMFELASRHPGFHFGVLEEREIGVFEPVNFSANRRDFVVFSPGLKCVWPSQKMGLDIGHREWEKRAEQYLIEIETEKLQPVCVSEAAENGLVGNLTKIVGAKYDEFIDDRDHDVVVFYRNAEGENETELRMFREFANEIVEEGVATFKFGFVNAESNGPGGRGYPLFIRLPHVEMFPAAAKSTVAPMLAPFTKQGLRRFLKEYASLPNGLDVEPMSPMEARMELDSFGLILDSLPYDIRVLAEEYGRRLEQLVNGTQRATPTVRHTDL